MDQPTSKTAAAARGRRIALFLLNLVGGAAVLASYAQGIATHANAGDALWGAIPASLRPLYTTSMLTATVGYLVFAPWILLRLDPMSARVLGRFDYRAFFVLFAVVLVASTLWMPLTFTWLASPSELLYLAIRVDLALVGLGAIGLCAAIATARPVPSKLGKTIALVGALLFAFQTAVLDGTVWPALFRG